MYLQEPPRGDGASSSVNFLHRELELFIHLPFELELELIYF